MRPRRFGESIATQLQFHRAAKFVDFAAIAAQSLYYERIEHIPCKILEALVEIMGGCLLWTFGVCVGDVYEGFELALELPEPIFSLESRLEL